MKQNESIVFSRLILPESNLKHNHLSVNLSVSLLSKLPGENIVFAAMILRCGFQLGFNTTLNRYLTS